MLIQSLRLLALREVVLFLWATWVPYDFDFNSFVSVYMLKTLTKPVQMMAQCSSFSFTLLEDLQAKIVGIPYKNNDLSMFVLLPNDIDGLEKVNCKPWHLLVYTVFCHCVASPVPSEPGNKASEHQLPGCVNWEVFSLCKVGTG